MEKTFRIISHEEVEVITTIQADTEEGALALWQDFSRLGYVEHGDTIERTLVEIAEVNE